MDNFYNSANDNTMHTPHTGDPALDSLLHETNVAIQDARDFSLPDDMIINAVNAASDFWHIPHPAIMHSETTCEIPGNPTTYADDVIGICRQQMIEMGVYGEDAMGLVASHETFHRVLQNYSAHGVLDSWEHELACDFAAGIRAGYQNMDVTHFENSLINTPGGETHPVGTLRVDFIEHAKHIGEQMREDGVQPNFENCIEAFNRHLIEEDSLIAQQREAVSHNELVAEQVNDGQVSFTGKYTDAEISKLRKNANDLERQLSYKNSNVHSHENRVNNADTTKGHENGSYAQEVSELKSARAERDNIALQLRNANSKLNNAL
jgi:hypothetical protein